MVVQERIPAPQSLLKNLNNLSARWREDSQPVLLFALEVLTFPEHNERQIDPAADRHLNWICEEGRYHVGILADRPVYQLRDVFRNPQLLLLGSAGYEIEGSQFRWRYPGIATALTLLADWKTELMQGYGKTVGESIRDHGSWLELDVASLASATRKRILTQLLRKVEENPKIELKHSDTRIILRPREMWDRGQSLHNLLNLLPRREGRPPQLAYIGSQSRDDAAFRYLHQKGVSIYYGDTVPVYMQACFYLKGRTELNRFLYWLHSH